MSKVFPTSSHTNKQYDQKEMSNKSASYPLDFKYSYWDHSSLWLWNEGARLAHSGTLGSKMLTAFTLGLAIAAA